MRFTSCFVIVNPAAGNGLGGRKWPKISKLLTGAGFKFEHAFSTLQRDGVRFHVSRALEQGYRLLICVGGDGTLHGVINELMACKGHVHKEVVVGLIPVGSGNDWVKTYGIPKQPNLAVNVLKTGKIVRQDIGRITFNSGQWPTTYAINVAGAGFDAAVVHNSRKFKQFGKLAYLLSALMSLGRFQNYNARILIDDREVADHFKLIQFGICRFTGGGMQLTEQPDPFDGLFDISIGGRLRAIDVLTNVFRLFNGSITRHPKIKTFKGSHLRVDYDSNCTLAVQADGEWLGEGAFEARILHKTISVIVPDAAFCED